MENSSGKTDNQDSSTNFEFNQVEKLDSYILFPPTSKVVKNINKEQFTSNFNDKIEIEYIDLEKVPKKILNKLSLFIPKEEIEVLKEQDDTSESENSQSSENKLLEIDINQEFEDFNIVDEFDQIKYNQDPTHFFSLTFNNNSNELINEFKSFKKEIEKSVDYGDIKSNYFIGEKKLHITLGLVKLETDDDFLNCKNSLYDLVNTDEFKELIELSDKNKGFPIELQGLGYFGSVYKSKVIYSKIVNHDKITLLKRLWCKLCELLIINKVNITIPEDHSTDKKITNIYESIINDFKPHVTFINTKYGNHSKNTRKTFDSSNLLKVYSKKHFGIGYISEIQLNELSSYEQNNLEYNERMYKCIFSVKINNI